MKFLKKIKLLLEITPFFSIVYLVIDLLLHLVPNVEIESVKKMTDYMMSNEWNAALFYICVLISILVIKGIQSQILSILDICLQNKVAKKMYPKLYDSIYHTNILNLDKAEFLLEVKKARTAIDGKILEDFYTITSFAGTIISVVAVCISVTRISPIYLGIFIFMVIIQNAFVFCYTKESIDLMQFHNKKQREHDYFNELLQDKSAIKEIRSFFVFDWLENKRKDIYNNIESSHIKFSGKWTKTNIFWSSIMFLIEAMLLLFLVEQTRIGNIDVGQVILILQSNVLFVSSVSNMIDLASKLKQNDMYVEAFNEVSEYQKLEHRICKEASKDLLVNLKNIVFKYNDRLALNGIDFFMRKGEKIVILGENGSGKSTLVKIILGLLKEDSGIIMVNAEQKSAVFQDFSKFRFTVRENIGIGQQNYMIDDLKISTAIEDVGLHKLKKRLVRGYDTELGKEFFKDGLELSGGEWQKTAIARGIFKDTDLIIFDEPTAAIDPLSEKKQFEDLMDLCEEKGVIIVSHRVGVVHLADRVVFMKSGKIVCEGKHNDLMQKNQSYREFYKSQAKWYV